MAVFRRELDPVSVGLFEVIPDEFLVLRCAFPDRARQPLAEALVERGTLLLRDGLVGRVSDQDMTEPHGLAAADI